MVITATVPATATALTIKVWSSERRSTGVTQAERIAAILDMGDLGAPPEPRFGRGLSVPLMLGPSLARRVGRKPLDVIIPICQVEVADSLSIHTGFQRSFRPIASFLSEIGGTRG